MSRWPARSFGVAVAAALLLPCSLTLAQGQGPPNYRATTEIVRLRVAVFAEDGGPAPILGQHDFRILENGRSRDIEVFLGPEDRPMEIAMAVDMSGSMAAWESRRAFHHLLDAVPTGSCVLLLPFKDDVGRGVWGRVSDSRLRRVIDETPQDGDHEAVYDALIAAFSALRERAIGSDARTPLQLGQLVGYRSPSVQLAPVAVPEGACSIPEGDGVEPRRAVVLVSDEPDSASRASLDDVLLASWGSGIPVFTLAVTSRDDPDNLAARNALIRQRLRRQAAERYSGPLETLAKFSGGFVVRGSKGRYDERSERWVSGVTGGEITALDGVERLGRVLSGHYVLGFAPESADPGGDPLVRESSVEVRVDREDVEVLTSRQLATGQARSAGAALDAALRGFRALSVGRYDDGLTGFEQALSMDRSVGLFHYGRGLALATLARYRPSLEALEQAEALAPWLPEVNARIAHVALETGELDVAWAHAIRAHFRGSEVAALVTRLQELAPRPIDLNAPPDNPLVGLLVEGRGTGLAGALASPAVVAVVMNLMQSSSVMQLSMRGSEGTDLVLKLRLLDAAVNGPWVSVSGRLSLEDREGREWAAESFRIHDARESGPVTEALVPAFESLEAALRDIDREEGS